MSNVKTPVGYDQDFCSQLTVADEGKAGHRRLKPAETLRRWHGALQKTVEDSPQAVVLTDQQGQFVGFSKGTFETLKALAREKHKPGLSARVLETIRQLAVQHCQGSPQSGWADSSQNGVEVNVNCWEVRDSSDQPVARLIQWNGHNKNN